MLIEDIPKEETSLFRVSRMAYFSIITAAGLLLLLFPQRGLALGAFLLGLWLLIEGFRAFIALFKLGFSLAGGANRLLLIRGAIMLLAGVLFLLRPGNMAQVGIWLIFFVTGLLFLLQAAFIWAMGEGELTGGILVMGIIGILLMVSPLFSAYWFLRLLGLFISLRGAMGIYILWSQGPKRS